MLILYLCALLLALVSGWFILYKVPVLKASAIPKPKAGNLSIIIPARNEAHNLPILLDSLRRQKLQPLEIIVVDDESEDQTVSVAQKIQAKVIQLADEELAWQGKSAACFAGAKAARGELLLFLDADIFLPHSNSLSRILQAFDQQNEEGLLSIQPYHIMHQPYENLSAVFNILVLAGMNRFSYLRDKLEPGGAFGPSLLCKKETYFELGGHEAVQTEIMENVALGKRFIDKHLPVNLYGGEGSLHFRMYPEGLSSLGTGWTKSFASGAASTHPIVMTGTSIWIAGAFISFFYLIYTFFTGDPLAIMFATIGYFLYFGLLYHMAQKAGNFQWFALLLYPVLFVYFVGIYLYSMVRTFIVGTVSWKGREMEV